MPLTSSLFIFFSLTVAVLATSSNPLADYYSLCNHNLISMLALFQGCIITSHPYQSYSLLQSLAVYQGCAMVISPIR